jgi:hypothetical protein
MNEMAIERPVPGRTYTLKEILKNLALGDSPFLRFPYEGKICVIQDGSLSDDELLAVEGLAETKWRYQYTTSELCPLFMYVDDTPITDLVVIEKNKRVHQDGADPYYVCFKASYLPQN